MKVEEQETDKFFRTFVKTLGRYRIGQSLLREVSISSSKDRKSQQCFRSTSFDKTRRVASVMQSHKKEKFRTDVGEHQEDVKEFRIRQNNLGSSFKMRETHFAPKNVYRSDKIQQQQKSKLMVRQMTRDRNNSAYNAILNMRKDAIMQQFLRIRMQWLKINRIDYILSTLMPNQNVATLRIYKQRLRRFYVHRYKREKITYFFDYQYIEDYDSQLKYLQTLLSLKVQEIHFLCFLVLDQNSDGLICNTDLFNAATVAQNPLMNKDIYKIFSYVSYHQKTKPDQPILDTMSDEEYFKPEVANLQKYRLLEHRQEKQKEKSAKQQIEEDLKNGFCLIGSLQADLVKKRARDKKVITVTRKTHRHLFSCIRDGQEGEEAIKQLRRKIASSQLQKKSNFKFKINFSKFKTIFADSIPQTYFDILYAVGGIQLPDKHYLPLNFDIDDPQKQYDESTGIIVDRYNVVQNRLDKMRQTNLRSNLQRFSLSSLGVRWPQKSK